ncbi:MAG TPA: alpha/beta hydrolase [Geminicoccaceae bacterium]|nr:alpha/beta hydrolase [Geminicoccus sp.]HMU50158.1 alpha/beta hydrolase [Geminicoccaceae bacterium]
MVWWLTRWLRRAVLLLAVVFATLLAGRAIDTQRGPPLQPWHTHVPKELDRTELERTDWAGYLAAEQAAFDGVRREVTDRLPPEARVPANRYFAGSPIHPAAFAHDWNRSFALEPDGPPKGVVVLLHGLTDAPYSLRHVARLYRAHGYLALGIRLPAHGTVPAALTEVEWEDWLAATRLAVREARRRVAAPAPLHIVGYSNGGALALKYALDAIEDGQLARPDRLVLISPMIGVTAFARFAGLAGLPAIFPAFAKAAWLDSLPEFNPFKYNSFPVNAARQSSRLTGALQGQIADFAGRGLLGRLPPTLTFQSVLDSTVSASAVVTAFYGRLPDNGSELVLFDLNRGTKLGPLIQPSAEAMLGRMLPPPPRAFRSTVINNAITGSDEVAESVVEPGSSEERSRPLGLVYPRSVVSLSHVALPFPLSDSLYGLEPDEDEFFGVHLGTVAARGERGTLIVSIDSLLRMSSNPFFAYVLERIAEGIADGPSG